MFQYLFSARSEAWRECDGITRRVTLDKQYRMHPLLRPSSAVTSTNALIRQDNSAPGDLLTILAIRSPARMASLRFGWMYQLGSEASKGQEPVGRVLQRPLSSSASWISDELGWGKDSPWCDFFLQGSGRPHQKQLRHIADNDKKLRVGTVNSLRKDLIECCVPIHGENPAKQGEY